MSHSLLGSASPILTAPRALLPRSIINLNLRAGHKASSFFLPALLTSSSHYPPPFSRQFTSAQSTMADSKPLMKAVASRRTFYALSPSSPIPDSRIQELLTETIKNTPSAFNSQTTRLVLVLKKEHEKLWDTITEVYKQQLPDEKFQHAKGRFEMFRKGYGTVRHPKTAQAGCDSQSAVMR